MRSKSNFTAIGNVLSDMPLLLVRSDWSFSMSVKSWFSDLYALENPVVKDVFCSSACKLFSTNMCFRCKKIIEKENGRFKFFEVIVLCYTLPLYGWIYIYSHRSPQRKLKNEHMMHGFFLEEYPMSL